MPVTKVKMPRRHDGTLPPNPIRYACGYGHLHPSDRHARKCIKRHLDQAQRADSCIKKHEDEP
jgi:hypothetical protein